MERLLSWNVQSMERLLPWNVQFMERLFSWNVQPMERLFSWNVQSMECLFSWNVQSMESLLSWNVCYHGTFSPWIVCFMERLVHIAFCSQEALYQIGCCVPIQDVMSPITFCPLDFISQRTLCSVHITLCVIRCFSMHWTFGSCTILHSRTCCPMVMLSLSGYILNQRTFQLFTFYPNISKKT